MTSISTLARLATLPTALLPTHSAQVQNPQLNDMKRSLFGGSEEMGEGPKRKKVQVSLARRGGGGAEGRRPEDKGKGTKLRTIQSRGSEERYLQSLPSRGGSDEREPRGSDERWGNEPRGDRLQTLPSRESDERWGKERHPSHKEMETLPSDELVSQERGGAAERASDKTHVDQGRGGGHERAVDQRRGQGGHQQGSQNLNKLQSDKRQSDERQDENEDARDFDQRRGDQRDKPHSCVSHVPLPTTPHSIRHPNASPLLSSFPSMDEATTTDEIIVPDSQPPSPLLQDVTPPTLPHGTPVHLTVSSGDRGEGEGSRLVITSSHSSQKGELFWQQHDLLQADDETDSLPPPHQPPPDQPLTQLSHASENEAEYARYVHAYLSGQINKSGNGNDSVEQLVRQYARAAQDRVAREVRGLERLFARQRREMEGMREENRRLREKVWGDGGGGGSVRDRGDTLGVGLASEGLPESPVLRKVFLRNPVSFFS